MATSRVPSESYPAVDNQLGLSRDVSRLIVDLDVEGHRVSVLHSEGVLFRCDVERVGVAWGNKTNRDP